VRYFSSASVYKDRRNKRGEAPEKKVKEKHHERKQRKRCDGTERPRDGTGRRRRKRTVVVFVSEMRSNEQHDPWRIYM